MSELVEYRCFIGGLSWSTSDRGLKHAFEKFGHLVEAKVVVDRFSGRSRGFGFVTFDEKKLFMKFDGGKSNKQTKIIAPQSNDHAHLKFLVKAGAIGNLVHSSPNIKKEVLVVGASQPFMLFEEPKGGNLLLQIQIARIWISIEQLVPAGGWRILLGMEKHS